MEFLYNNDQATFNILSAKPLYHSIEGKIAIFTICAYKNRGFEKIPVGVYRAFRDILNQYDDVKVRFEMEDKTLVVDRIDFDPNTHLKDGFEVVTVYFE